MPPTLIQLELPGVIHAAPSRNFNFFYLQATKRKGNPRAKRKAARIPERQDESSSGLAPLLLQQEQRDMEQERKRLNVAKAGGNFGAAIQASAGVEADKLSHEKKLAKKEEKRCVLNALVFSLFSCCNFPLISSINVG